MESRVKRRGLRKKAAGKERKSHDFCFKERFTLSSLLLLCIFNHRKRRTQHKFPLSVSLSLSLTDQHAIILPLTGPDQNLGNMKFAMKLKSGSFDRKKKRIMWRHLKFKQKSLKIKVLSTRSHHTMVYTLNRTIITENHYQE